ncbi:MAG: cation:proton antiporter subunit C [Thermodesulfobacteriota bacterium]
MIEFVVSKYNYWVYVVLIMIGFYGMMAKNNLMKKLIGMNIFQWSIILFYISIGSKKGGTVPIIDPSLHATIRAIDYINPLPHVLMLTAIVVGVATTGIALTLLILIYRKYGTLEEDEILEALKK